MASPETTSLEATRTRLTFELKRKLDSFREALLSVGEEAGTAEGLEELLAAVRAAAGPSVEVTVLRQRGTGAADVLCRLREGEGPQVELRVAVIGNVDAGKSTLISVLTSHQLDDGRGSARRKIFRHEHEQDTGRTSSISQLSMCFSSSGKCMNDEGSHRSVLTEELVNGASKILTLVDLCGHERYLRTTCFGLTGHLPEYAMVLVGANAGLVGMCREHLGIVLALHIPAFFVVTKIDFSPEEVTRATMADLTAVLKKPGVRKRPFIVRTLDDVYSAASNMATDTIAPIFLVSSVDGRGLDRLRLFLNLLPQRIEWGLKEKLPAEFVIDEIFVVPGVGTVVAGTLTAGTLSETSKLMLGPDPGDGLFKAVQIRSIHYKRCPATLVVAGQAAALALKKIKRNSVRKGMVLCSPALSPAAAWEFDAEIAILTHSSTIAVRYQAVVHAGVVRQTAVIVSMSVDLLRSGDRAQVRFRFLLRPEYVQAGSRFIFREGRTKGIGLVVNPPTAT